MFFLAGLLGMMALGSVVMVSTSADEDSGDDADIQPETDTLQDTAQDIDGGAIPSLFEQMGLPQDSAAGVFDDEAENDWPDETVASASLFEDVLPADRDIADEDVVQFTDFDQREDQLMVVFDDSEGEESPELEIRLSEGDENTTELVVGGIVVATLPTEDAPVLDAIVLVGESAASDFEEA